MRLFEKSEGLLSLTFGDSSLRSELALERSEATVFDCDFTPTFYPLIFKIFANIFLLVKISVDAVAKNEAISG